MIHFEKVLNKHSQDKVEFYLQSGTSANYQPGDKVVENKGYVPNPTRGNAHTVKMFLSAYYTSGCFFQQHVLVTNYALPSPEVT